MKLIELIQKCSKGYEKDFPESSLTCQCDAAGVPWSWEEYQRQGIGDTLGRFVVLEISETFDEDTSDESQIHEAILVIQNAMTNLDNILSQLWSEMWSEKHDD